MCWQDADNFVTLMTDCSFDDPANTVIWFHISANQVHSATNEDHSESNGDHSATNGDSTAKKINCTAIVMTFFYQNESQFAAVRSLLWKFSFNLQWCNLNDYWWQWQIIATVLQPQPLSQQANCLALKGVLKGKQDY